MTTNAPDMLATRSPASTTRRRRSLHVVPDRPLSTSLMIALAWLAPLAGGATIVVANTSIADCNANGVEDAVDLETGTSFDCDENGIPDECETGGEVVVFGENNRGELDVPADLPPCVDAAAGGDFVIAATVDGDVVGWGRSDEGATTPPADLPSVFELSAGSGHVLALDPSGVVHAWGRNGDGQCDVPADLGLATAVAGGRLFSMALLPTGDVRCWGDNTFGQCDVPVFGGPVASIAAGDYHGLAILESGDLVAWGWNADGQCDVPAGLDDVVEVRGGSFHTIARRGDGTVVAWGRDDDGQCDVPDGLRAIRVEAGFQCSMAFDLDGDFVAWGELGSGKGSPAGDFVNPLVLDTGGTHTVVLEARGDIATDTDGDGIADCIDPCPTWPGDCSEDGRTIVVAAGESIALALATVPTGGTLQLGAGVHNEPIDFAGRAFTVQGDVADPSSVVLDGTGLDTSVVRVTNGEGPDSILRGVTVRGGVVGSPFNDAIPTGFRIGGGLYIRNSDPLVEFCRFESNAADSGGGISVRGGRPTIVDTIILDNEALIDGGGLYALSAGQLRLEGTTLRGNRAGRSGGGMEVRGGGFSISDGAIEGNVVAGPGAIGGGGLGWTPVSQGGTGIVSTTSITGNEAPLGGGVFIADETRTLPVFSTTVCDNLGGQFAGTYEDLGDNCVTEFCDSDDDGVLDCDATCTADLDGDGDIGGADLGLFLVEFGSTCDPALPCPADLDGDGAVTGGDLGILLVAWGACP